jgi:hypothetical protein
MSYKEYRKEKWIMNKFCVVSALLVLPLLLMDGCTTMADARKDKGHGTARIYKTSFEKVWTTVPTALSNLGLSVAGENKEEGYILGQKGPTALSPGENVAIFIEKVNTEQTSVEVVSKKSLKADILAKDWEKPVLDKLSELLEGKK